ncbi:ATP-binding cassette domain-containing protein [Heliobacillus mobilis]|uniref:ATP-binding cassette domain-containing protein n=1 Tax=Heliobacterium mobile TaxID=28064 RepID=A0A6I3SHD4_HELMO|nr:ABC transporter ATP-binding protein [Heliobacterium mobile]MTV48215.1 ATP-binding cassette domain-containing protein [Heliobacterium mobile]
MLKLYRFLKPYRLYITFVLSLLFLQSLSELYLPTLMADIVNLGIVTGDDAYILRIGAFMLLVAAGGTLCSVIASYFSSKTVSGFSQLLRSTLFSHVENFSLHDFNRFGTASLITRTTNDINQLQQVLTMMLRMMISAPLMCVGGIIMAVYRDAHLSLVLAAVIPILSTAIWVVARKGVPLFKAIQTKLDKLNLVLRESLMGIRVIRSFNRVDHQKERFTQANLDLTDTAIKVNRVMASLMPIMMLVMNLSMIAIVWFGGLRIDSGNMQVGDLMAFIQYAMQIMFSLIMLSFMFVMVPRASVSAARIQEVLDTVPTITDPYPMSATQAVPEKAGRGTLEFQHVSFSYPGAEQPVLSDISFQAKRGEITAIIGGTGSGKTTLLSLIPRFYDVNQGAILIDGVDVRQMGQKELRQKIGYVSQKALLFSGTIAENIRYGNNGASDEAIGRAAQTAQATEFIASMSDGMDSFIDQGGANLSGGQKQRLSIARALARKAQIYLFDDSFSALDFKTDAQLRSALKSETKDAAVLLVAQRVSTVMDANRIIVLDEGRIAGIGTHRELMRACTVYQEIVASQLSEEEIA